MIDKGVIKIQRTKRGFSASVQINKKTIPVPSSLYEIRDDSLHNKECEVERHEGQIKRIIIGGNELPRRGSKVVNAAKETNRQKSDPLIGKAHPSKNDEKLWSIENARIPHDTKCAFLNHNLSENDIDNYYLKLAKFAQMIDEKFLFYKTDKGKIKLNITPNYKIPPIAEITKRQQYMIKCLSAFHEVKTKKLKTHWRLIVGLGGGSVYETSMTLHHVYGIPYIPGSAVKGVVRNFIIAECFGNDETNALYSIDFCDIFGCPNNSIFKEARRGKVIFMDAFPIGDITIKPDIMNPHYGDYYSNAGKIPPADYLSPNPIPFLTVENTEFCFYLLTKKKDAEIFNRRIGDRAIIAWLEEALREQGIGAKTAVGYGRFVET